MKLIAKPSVGEYLRDVLTKNKLTWEALAEPLQLKTEEAVAMLLDDKVRIVIKRVPFLADALKIDGIELMGVVLANYSPETLIALDKVTEGLFLSDKALVIVDLLEVTISKKSRQ